MEIGRFADSRLKVVKRYVREDSNFRMESNGASVVPKIREVELERDVLEAIGIWNAMKEHPEVREEIIEVLRRYNIEI